MGQRPSRLTCFRVTETASLGERGGETGRKYVRTPAGASWDVAGDSCGFTVPRTVRPQLAPMPITHLFAGVAVSDFAAARRWYEALFGRPPDMLPKEGEAVWHVTTFGSVYVTADPGRAGSALVTIAVSNLDEHATALAARGLSLDELGADSSALRQLTITDDDGNCIKFFADPAQPTA
jgi:hypothetical protein